MPHLVSSSIQAETPTEIITNSRIAMYGANIHLTGNLKWRLPLWLQILCPGLACLGSFLLPESPRWQIAQGKYEEARRFIIKHHANGDSNHPIVAIEMQEIEDSLVEVQSRSVFACFDLRSLFKSRARLYRVMLVVAMGWFGQFSGNNVASYYLPIMVQNVGITSTNMVLLLNAIYAVTGWVAATIGGMSSQVLGCVRKELSLMEQLSHSSSTRYRWSPQNAHGLVSGYVGYTRDCRWYSCFLRAHWKCPIKLCQYRLHFHFRGRLCSRIHAHAANLPS